MNWRKILTGALAYLILAVILATYVSFAALYALPIGAFLAGALTGWKGGSGPKGAFNGALAGIIGGFIGGAISGYITIPLAGSQYGALVLTTLLGPSVASQVPAALGGAVTFATAATGLVFGAIGGYLGASAK